MTGFSALPTADEAASEGSSQWAGVAKILGPPWVRFPTITVGLVGVQVLWSIEMAYGEQSSVPCSDIVLTQDAFCSFAIPHLPRPLEISNVPRIHRWTPFRAHRSTSHRYASTSHLLHPHSIVS